MIDMDAEFYLPGVGRKRLRDLTRADVARAADFCARQAREFRTRAAAFRLLARTMGDKP